MSIELKKIIKNAIFLIFLFQVGDLAVFSILKNGMDHYFGMDEPAEILCIGYSHTVLGIDAQRLEEELGVPVAKYALAGANTLDRLWMLKQFVGTHPTVKTVVYDVDPRLFDSEGLSSASYTLFLPFIADTAISKYLKLEATWQEYHTSRFLRTARFRDQSINIALRGLLGKVENKKSSKMRIEDHINYLDREKNRKIRINPESLECFLESVDFLVKNDIRVFLVYIPVVDLLNEIDSENQRRVIEIYRETAINNKQISFLDYNKDYQNNHELFYDLRHLNSEGNKIITGRLISDLKVYTSDRSTKEN